jgi:hypothetical protein
MFSGWFPDNHVADCEGMMWTAKREKDDYGDHLVFMDGDRVVMELHDILYDSGVEMPSDEDVTLICEAMNNQKKGNSKCSDAR